MKFEILFAMIKKGIVNPDTELFIEFKCPCVDSRCHTVPVDGVVIEELYDKKPGKASIWSGTRLILKAKDTVDYEETKGTDGNEN